MFNNFRVGELDFVMLSFDEPNADDNFRDLQTIVPTAKRSHGVKGFDAAHRAAADKAETPVFVTVDADNVIDPELLNFKVFNPRARDKFAISLNGINSTNGLVYGNGSIKIWAKKFIYEMNSHENRSEDDGTVDKCDKKSVDFCFEEEYNSTADTCYSFTVTNGSEYQSWRSGFREGAKKAILFKEQCMYYKHMGPINPQQMIIWATVGADVKYGDICCDAAVCGMMMYFGNHIPVTGINDYDWLQKFYDSEWPYWKKKLPELRRSLGAILKIPDVPLLDPIQSQMFKRYTSYQKHIGKTTQRITEWEIV